MANGISKNPLTDIGKVYLTQIAEGRLKSLEKASVLAMSDKPVRVLLCKYNNFGTRCLGQNEEN